MAGSEVATSAAEPELINTCTIGTENNKAGAAAIIVFAELIQLRFTACLFILNSNIHSNEVIIKIVPGE